MAKNEDLNRPLYRNVREWSLPWRSFAASAVISAALLLAVIAALWVAVVDDPDGGRAEAVAAIEDAAPAATGSVAAAGGLVPDEPMPQVTDDEPALAALPFSAAAIGGDPGLVQQSAYGPLPRVSPDGRRPRDVYARRTDSLPSGAARVVLIVGGLGLSQTGTQNAISRLPEEVTLAFAPYGASLQRWASKAREEGHEIMLQVPMEPVGYPEQNPGEHTLLASAGGRNRDDLHWILGRMTGYAGVMNHMGGRFTAEEQAMVPFLGEIGERGLYYLDDGTSPQSRAKLVAEALRVPFLTADRIVDRSRAQGEIERELAALEAAARARGLAVGVASAFPASVETIARWAREAQSRGVFVVPASAAFEL